MSSFKRAFQRSLGFEGGYSNNRYDPGGKTKYGITEAVARKHGYNGDMKDLSYSLAKEIYKSKYWDVLLLDRISVIASQEVAEKLFDVGVNMGVGTAGKFLQRSLSSFEDDITVDGVVGPETIGMLKQYMNHRDDPHTLFKAINCLQGNRYIELTEHNKDFKEFNYGWYKRIS